MITYYLVIILIRFISNQRLEKLGLSRVDFGYLLLLCCLVVFVKVAVAALESMDVCCQNANGTFIFKDFTDLYILWIKQT